MKERTWLKEKFSRKYFCTEAIDELGYPQGIKITKKPLSPEQLKEHYFSRKKVAAFRTFELAVPLFGNKGNNERRNISGTYFMDGVVFTRDQLQETVDKLVSEFDLLTQKDNEQRESHEKEKQERGDSSKYPIFLSIEGLDACGLKNKLSDIYFCFSQTSPDLKDDSKTKFVQDRIGGWHEFKEEDTIITS